MAELRIAPAVYTIYYDSPSFEIWTPENEDRASFELPSPHYGLLVSLLKLAHNKVKNTLATSEAGAIGDEVSKRADWEDPALLVKDKFLALLEKNLELRNWRQVKEAATKDTETYLKSQFSEGAVLDFKTLRYGLWTYPSDAFHYHLRYKARARLVSLTPPKMLWQAFCDIDQWDLNNSPTLEEYVADNGALLRRKLNEAAIGCAEDLQKQFFCRESFC